LRRMPQTHQFHYHNYLAMPIGEGEACPKFATVDHDGNPVTSESLQNKTFVLYFYPKDDTPGCTIEAQEFRDHLGTFHHVILVD
jgi:peroxiredoxin Q/BCP